jgi:truncated hemoglobin YjbI
MAEARVGAVDLVALRSAFARFYALVLEDPLLCYLFADADMGRILNVEVEMMGRVLGADLRYSGRPLARVHRPVLMLEGHTRRRTALLADLLPRYLPRAACDLLAAHEQRVLPAIAKGVDRHRLPGRYGLFLGTEEDRARWSRIGLTAVVEGYEDQLLRHWDADREASAEWSHTKALIFLNRIREHVLGQRHEWAVHDLVAWVGLLLRERAVLSRTTVRALTIGLAAVAPRAAEALWELIGQTEDLYLQDYPIGPPLLGDELTNPKDRERQPS